MRAVTRHSHSSRCIRSLRSPSCSCCPGLAVTWPIPTLRDRPLGGSRFFETAARSRVKERPIISYAGRPSRDAWTLSRISSCSELPLHASWGRTHHRHHSTAVGVRAAIAGAISTQCDLRLHFLHILVPASSSKVFTYRKLVGLRILRLRTVTFTSNELPSPHTGSHFAHLKPIRSF